jgi:hypothetical protein
MKTIVVLASMVLAVFSGNREFWDPEDAATPSVLKFIDQFDLDNDQLFEKGTE